MTIYSVLVIIGRVRYWHDHHDSVVGLASKCPGQSAKIRATLGGVKNKVYGDLRPFSS